MARTVKEILEHADELAARFETGDFEFGDEAALAAHNLRMATITRAQAERSVHEAVWAARAADLSWKRIGAELGTSAQAAQTKYSDSAGYPQSVAVIGATALVPNLDTTEKSSRGSKAGPVGRDSQVKRSEAAASNPPAKSSKAGAVRTKRA